MKPLTLTIGILILISNSLTAQKVSNNSDNVDKRMYLQDRSVITEEFKLHIIDIIAWDNQFKAKFRFENLTRYPLVIHFDEFELTHNGTIYKCPKTTLMINPLKIDHESATFSGADFRKGKITLDFKGVYKMIDDSTTIPCSEFPLNNSEKTIKIKGLELTNDRVKKIKKILDVFFDASNNSNEPILIIPHLCKLKSPEDVVYNNNLRNYIETNPDSLRKISSKYYFTTPKSKTYYMRPGETDHLKFNFTSYSKKARQYNINKFILDWTSCFIKPVIQKIKPFTVSFNTTKD